MRRDFRQSAKQSQLWLETSHPPSADRCANPSDPPPYRQLAATGDQQKVRNGAKARPINKFNRLRPKPGSQGRLNCRGISSRGANGPDRHWVGWGAAIGTEALDGARARPPATLSRRTQLYFGVRFGRAPRPRQPSRGPWLGPSSSAPTVQTGRFETPGADRASPRATRHPGRDQLWLALRV